MRGTTVAGDPSLNHELKMNTIQLRKANEHARNANRIAAANLLVSLGDPVPQELLDRITREALND